jgi:hypothetical protein
LDREAEHNRWRSRALGVKRSIADRLWAVKATAGAASIRMNAEMSVANPSSSSCGVSSSSGKRRISWSEGCPVVATQALADLDCGHDSTGRLVCRDMTVLSGWQL